ncbi:hypothetical protein AO738_12360 [Pseudomonas citronellolis]|nr:hypothetical protein AO742_15345 [Pseudomonas citronellolis]KRW78605.1 hypothetical protein AO738_12360 [Pseudomonas citronellolis]
MSRQGLVLEPGTASSSLGRVRIISVAIALADLTFFVVDEELALLVDRNAACVLYRFGLGVELLCRLGVAFTFYSPIVTVRDDVLVLAHEFYLKTRLWIEPIG